MERLWQDVQFGFRVLRKSPGFTAIAVVTLALGIGANTAMFSILHKALLQPLPYPAPEQLVLVRDIQPGGSDFPGSYHEFEDWREQEQIFEATAAYRPSRFTLTGDGKPERITGVILTPALQTILGLRILQGRALEEADDHPDAERVALIGYDLWQRRWGGNSQVLGSIIRVDSEPVIIVGILAPGAEALLPRELRGGWRANLWLPLRMNRETTNRGSHSLTVVARLKSGVTIEAATAEVERVAQTFKDDGRTRHGFHILSVPGEVTSRSRSRVLLLMGAVGFILLIACANIANLLLARGAGRQKEFAIRSSQGAQRFRLVRQLVTESMLLAAGGGIAGLALAWGLLKTFSASGGVQILRTGEVALSAPVLLATIGMTLIAGLLFGAAPALFSTRTDLVETLKEGGRKTDAGTTGHGFRNALVVVEIGLSVVLLAGTGLLLRSFQNLLNVDIGFDTANALTFQLSLPQSQFSSGDQVIPVFVRYLEAMNALPGVTGVGLVTTLPVEGGWNSYYKVEGQAWPDTDGPLIEVRTVNPDYHRTLGIPLMSGRYLSDSDVADAQNVIVVDQEFVRRAFPDGDPIGRIVYQSEDAPHYQIAGVVGNVEHWGVGNETRPSFYFPYRQMVNTLSPYIILRTPTDPASLTRSAERAIASVNPDQPLSRVRTMAEVVSDRVATRRLFAVLITSFALLALFLASIGLYGVISYSVSQRTHEIGIRIAIGASRPDVLRLILSSAGKLVLGGLVAGVLGAVWATRYLESQLFGVDALDIPTFAGIPIVLVVVATAACLIPALRATRVDPMVALRYE